MIVGAFQAVSEGAVHHESPVAADEGVPEMLEVRPSHMVVIETEGAQVEDVLVEAPLGSGRVNRE